MRAQDGGLGHSPFLPSSWDARRYRRLAAKVKGIGGSGAAAATWGTLARPPFIATPPPLHPEGGAERFCLTFRPPCGNMRMRKGPGWC